MPLSIAKFPVDRDDRGMGRGGEERLLPGRCQGMDLADLERLVYPPSPQAG